MRARETTCRRLPALLVALLALAPAAAAQEPPAPGSSGVLGAIQDLMAGSLAGRLAETEKAQELPGTGEFRLTTTNRLDFHARNLEVAEAFAQLRTLVQRNIVVAPEVTARFSGDLYDLGVEETIAAICSSTSLVARYDGPFIYIEPEKQQSRIFELRYVRAEDVVVLVQPLLSPTGLASASVASEVGIRSTQEEAGGDDYAFRDVLVVFDLPRNLEAIAELVATLDKRPRQVLIEATILSASLDDSFAAGIDFTILGGVDFEEAGAVSPDGTSVAVGPFAGATLDDGLSAADTRFLDVFPSGGLNVGYLKNGVGIFVKALQQLTNTTILANPRIVTLNKQRGEVLLGRRDGYLTSIVTQTSTTQRVEFLETGTRLIFRPFIGDDDFVRLEIHPEDSDGGITADGLPFKDTAEVTTNILVRSGQTVVIGGLFRDRKQTIDEKVPWLGDIPVLGYLFRSRTDVSIREEIIVMLTPHVLDAQDEGAVTLRDVGGLVDPHDLAGVYVHTARTLAAAADPGSALLFLEASGSLDPERLEAQSLKQKVVRQLVPAVERRAVDDRILRSMLADPRGARP